MEFEFDQNKSSKNKKKHGIDFVEAQRIWADKEAALVPANTTEEPRYLLIGKVEGRHWSAIFTLRGEKTRIISARRSREEEVRIYESK